MRIGLTGAVVLAAILAGGTAAFGGEQVNGATYGDDWPFPFAQAEVACDPPGSSVVLKTDGKIYALNGRALGQMAKRGYLDSRDLMPRDSDGFFTKGVNTVSELIQRGLQLCN
jgi:hypothetical protein